MSEEAEVLALAAQRVGTVLDGKYHLDCVLGVGGMATVYAATHRNRKRVAVKMLHTELSVRKELRTRFLREGYVANSVAHPGVVELTDDDVDETGAAFLVMELLEGATVDALYSIGGAPLPAPDALGIVYQLLDVLEAAHQKSVVHRDIKPGNLFITRDGRLKVLDFGIARLHEADSELNATRSGVMLGTPAFMAPEQALATPNAVDARTDIWGVGATLFTLLSARFVHEGASARQVMIRAATEPARSLDSIMPELPAPVVAIVARALSFERADRWQSAVEMRHAVLETYRRLYGSDPVGADIAGLLARSAAVLGSQPTESHVFTDGPLPASERRAVLETPTATPTTTQRPTPRVGTRRLRFWLIAGGAVLSFATLDAFRPAAKSTAPPAPLIPATTVESTRPRVASSELAMPRTTAPGPAHSALAPSARPNKHATALVSGRTPLPLPIPVASAATPEAPAVRAVLENPLRLTIHR